MSSAMQTSVDSDRAVAQLSPFRSTTSQRACRLLATGRLHITPGSHFCWPARRCRSSAEPDGPVAILVRNHATSASSRALLDLAAKSAPSHRFTLDGPTTMSA